MAQSSGASNAESAQNLSGRAIRSWGRLLVLLLLIGWASAGGRKANAGPGHVTDAAGGQFRTLFAAPNTTFRHRAAGPGDPVYTGYCATAASGEFDSCYTNLKQLSYMRKSGQRLYTGYILHDDPSGNCKDFFNPSTGTFYFSLICPGTQTVLSVQAQDRHSAYLQTQVIYSSDFYTPWSSPRSAVYVFMVPQTTSACASIYISVVCGA